MDIRYWPWHSIGISIGALGACLMLISAFEGSDPYLTLFGVYIFLIGREILRQHRQAQIEEMMDRILEYQWRSRHAPQLITEEILFIQPLVCVKTYGVSMPTFQEAVDRLIIEDLVYRHPSPADVAREQRQFGITQKGAYVADSYWGVTKSPSPSL